MRFLAIILSAGLLAPVASGADYEIGAGKADITGPAVGTQMWGFVRDGQITEGIHTRLFARAYVVADAEGSRIAFVSADIGSITHFMHKAIVEELNAEFGDTYRMDNTIISATHTHAGPGGFWHYGASTPLGSTFDREHFDAIVDGIVSAISEAHANLAPGSISIARGTLENAGANRSMPAYLNNPQDERARYDAPTDLDMTLIRFRQGDKDIGSINWFAVHPTAMTYNNRLISGDHKGRGSQLFEAWAGDGHIAAFAQSNCGDVTPNLNLNNTGPGEDEFDTTNIIATRQFAKAQELFESASETLAGPVDTRHVFMNMKWRKIDPAWTGTPGQMTCPSAYGYAFAAGSTEDGGGHPMFREGMTESNQMVDNLVKEQFGMDPPSPECVECQGEKAILFTSGETDPPAYTQILPVTLARIGQLVLVCVPAEFTTMAGRRLRDTIADTLGPDNYYVIAGYTNDYCGYVTTREEYATQNYEGGHTLYGPWTLAAYQETFHELATAMKSGNEVPSELTPRDFRDEVESAPLATGPDLAPEDGDFGDVVGKLKKLYKAGDVVEIAFWSGNPRNAFRTGNNYATVERVTDAGYEAVAVDNAWELRVRWLPDETITQQNGEEVTEYGALRFIVQWFVPEDAVPGEYRITHDGNYMDADGTLHEIHAATETFRIK